MTATERLLVPDVTGDGIDHGTYGGYQTCRRRPEGPCWDCRDAQRDYMRDYRARNPRYRKQEARANSARSRALWRLAQLHPDEFAELVKEEVRRDRMAT